MHSPSVKINRSLTKKYYTGSLSVLKVSDRVFPLEFMAQEQWSEQAIKPTKKNHILILQCLLWNWRTLHVRSEHVRSEDGDGSENVAFKVNSLFFNLHPDWFKSYMHDRQQYVRTGSEMSGMGISAHGVPQGPTLGLALYLMCTSTICLAFQFNVPLNPKYMIPSYIYHSHSRTRKRTSMALLDK